MGRLIYLTFTHPELCYVVCILSQFLQEPREERMEVAKHVLHYLKGNQVKEYCLELIQTYKSCLLWLRLGSLPINKEVTYWVLFGLGHSLLIVMKYQEAKDCFMLLNRSRISCFGDSYKWTHLDLILLNVTSSVPW